MTSQLASVASGVVLPKARSVHPGLIALVAVIGGWAALQVWRQQGADSAFERVAQEKPPGLFEAVVACPFSGAAAGQAAIELGDKARSKFQRYAFEATEGIVAVQLGQQAEACLRALGNAAAADELARRRAGWQAVIEADLAGYTLRLKRAQDNERWDDALSELSLVRELYAHRTDAYVRRLERLQLHLQAERALHQKR